MKKRESAGNKQIQEGQAQPQKFAKIKRAGLPDSSNLPLFLQNILDTIEDPVFVKDEDHRWIYLNNSTCRFWGYSCTDLIGKSDYEIFSREEADVYQVKDREVFETGKPSLNEELQTIKGKVHVISTKKSLYIDKESGARFIVGIIRDITDYKRVEDDLKESESLYRSLVELASDGIVIIQDKTVRYANPQIARLLDVPIQNLNGAPFLRYVHPDEKEIVGLRYKERMADGFVPTRYETMLINRSGEEVCVEISASKIEFNRKPAILAILRDITERKKKDEALRMNEKLLRHVLDSTPADIFVKDSEGRFLLVNSSTARSHGMTPEAMIGKMETELEDYDEGRKREIEKYLEDDRKVIQTKEPMSIPEELYTGPDGRTKWLQTTKVPLSLNEDCVLGIAIDVTERKNTEEALEKSEERFLQSQKMEAVGRLAGGVAHDFNNLLTAILGYSDLLILSKDMDQTKRFYAGEIKKVTERAARLTQQLLAFSRKQVLQPKIVALNTLVGELQKMLCRLIGEDILLVPELEPEPTFIQADPGQVEQVIVNLAINARDAMPGGGKLILKTKSVYVSKREIEEEEDLSPGWYTMLEVSDTGEGMDDETKSNIFEPFFTTKEIGRGTGLGLATVYGIVKQSGGFIRVFSEPNQGASFRIYFPRVDETAAKHPYDSEASVSLNGSETILIVEDEEAVRNLIEMNLKSFGYTVLKVKNAQAAISLCRGKKDTPIHLLITDVVMPGMNGCILAEKIREIHPEIQVLFISGHTENAIVHNGVLDDGITFLQKPFKMMHLAQKVRKLLDD